MTFTNSILRDAPGVFIEADQIPAYILNEPVESTSIGTFYSKLPDDCTIPKSIAELNSGVEFKTYKFDKSMNTSAAAMGFSGQIGKRQLLFIQDFIRYQLVSCNGSKKKFGIGLRCFIYVTSFKGRFGYTTLPGIAANVELGNARCSFELAALGFGIDGKILAEGLQPQGDYTVENFGKLAVVFNNVLKILNSNNTMKIEVVEFP